MNRYKWCIFWGVNIDKFFMLYIKKIFFNCCIVNMFFKFILSKREVKLFKWNEVEFIK